METVSSEKCSSLSKSDESTQTIDNIDSIKLIARKVKRENIIEDNDENKNIQEWRGKTISNRNKGIHSKYKEDNMIIKIKTFLFNSILFLINNSFIYNYQNDSLNNPSQNYRFLKIDGDKNYVINKEVNLLLLNTKIKDLFNENISNKYKIFNGNSNKELIKKIYEEYKETNVINILDLTYGEFLNIFRGTISSELENKMNCIQNIKEKFFNMKDFLNKIEREEIKKGEPDEKIKGYLEKLEDLCLNFENWFQAKKGRNRPKRIGNGY